jgi:hypothetical protein
MVAGTASASLIGVTASVIGSIIWGTAGILFIIGSSIGFAVGTYRWYVHSTTEAMVHLGQYPSLIRLHLASNFPRNMNFRNRDLNWFRSEHFG